MSTRFGHTTWRCYHRRSIGTPTRRRTRCCRVAQAPPNQPDFAIGAISEDGKVYENSEAETVSDEYFHRERNHELSVIRQLKDHIRQVRPEAHVSGRSVIVTDDGIATGATMIAALQTIRARNPAELIVAVPVAPADRIHDLELHCDEVICLVPAKHFGAVGQYYEDFPAVEDKQVIDILRGFVPLTT